MRINPPSGDNITRWRLMGQLLSPIIWLDVPNLTDKISYIRVIIIDVLDDIIKGKIDYTSITQIWAVSLSKKYISVNGVFRIILMECV